MHTTRTVIPPKDQRAERTKSQRFQFRPLLVAAILLAVIWAAACTTPTAPCVRGDPVLATNGDTLGWVCTNYRQ
jgi:hypothetical protein